MIFEKLVDLFRYNPETPMVFNSGLFLFLFPVFVVCYYCLRGRREWRILFVLGFSYFFYYKSSGMYFLLLLSTSLLDYVLAEVIYRSKTQSMKRLWVVLSVAANLGMLGYFKYTDFFREMWCGISGTEFLPLSIILPVGISFFTFQSLSYTIDVYKGQVTPLRRFMDYAFFVSFFPQLVAGPIVRARDFIPQMMAKVVVTQDMFGRGIFLILTGLFKKAIISDYISVNFVDRIFDAPVLYSGVENLMAVYGYALQIYCDFSGYSDMAIGIALLLGFHFKMNFNSPYKSQSVTEFWKRWHISLSTWLRDYLYIPLGGNRKGEWRTYLNLLTTMLLGGLWHGASLRFVFWGAWHGGWLVVERLYRKGRWKQGTDYILQNIRRMGNQLLNRKNFSRVQTERKKWRIWVTGMGQNLCKIGKFVSVCLCRIWQMVLNIWRKHGMLRRLIRTLFTFHIICFGWIFFRASTFAVAWEMIRQIFLSFRGYLFTQWLIGYDMVAWLMLLGYVSHFLPDKVENYTCAQLVRSSLAVKVAVLIIVIFIVMQVKSSEILPFIYFQF